MWRTGLEVRETLLLTISETTEEKRLTLSADNVSGWPWYRQSITQILQFGSLYQMPVVGPDVCGFGGNVTETLCARWATLGSFYTFFRNHAEIFANSQEFYRWDAVAEAARNGISIRYQLRKSSHSALLLFPPLL